VHGIFGGPESTWTNDDTHAYWPNLLVQDNTFGGNDIYVLGYDSPFFAPTYTFDNLIENTRLRLQDAEVFSKHTHVVFVCHSMGGLIVRGLLSRYDDLRKKVPLIYFLSAPTDGSHIAKIAQLISQNPQVQVLGPIPKNSDSILAMLQGNWRAMHNIPLSKCAYETLRIEA
jgi:triacylglycerol esterase/lipase EstA (alpha/beta hydrolase family)